MPEDDRSSEPAWGGQPFRALRAVAATLEPVLVLVFALLLATAAAAPLVPASSGLAFPLRAVSGAERPTDAELVELTERLELSDGVDIRLMRGAEQLILDRPHDRQRAVDAVRALLAENGYHETDPVDALPTDLGQLFEGRPTRLAALLSIQALALLLAGVGMARWRLRPERHPPIVGRSRALLEGCAAGLAALIASAGISGLLTAVGLPVEEQEWITQMFRDRASWLPIVPWLLLIGPVAEEIFFRGYMFRFIRQELGVNAAIVLSSLLFAAIHANLSGVPVYLAIGALFAYVYHRTGSLLAPIAGHALLNTVVLAASTGMFGG